MEETTMEAYGRVLSPGRIGALDVPNRIVRTAHATVLGGSRGLLNDDLVEYHHNQIKGGAGLSILEIATVHRSSGGGLRAYDDRIVPGYEALMERIEPLGARVFQQLWHGGAQSLHPTRPPWSASAVQPTPAQMTPVPMTHAQIEEIVGAFAAAAARVRAGGLHGVELHFAHGYLVQQFLSPLSNRREDEYGGDLDGRMRFALEIVDAVRSAVPASFPVGVRLSPEAVPGGLTTAENVAIARVLAATGKIDFIDASLGSYFHVEKLIGGMYEPTGYQLPSSERIAAATDLPTIVTGRITSVAEAERVLAEGAADFVGMTRAHIADPEVLAKSLAGKPEEVRPCIACDMCRATMETGGIGCTVNARVGREVATAAAAAVPPAASRRVVVVGGGPCGLETARVAAGRGHEVILIEREEALGGQLRFAGRAPHRERIGAIVRWLEREADRLGVDIRLGRPADLQSLAALDPDLVLLASGSVPRLDGLQWAAAGRPIRLTGGAELVSSWQVLGAPEAPQGPALVIDDRGHYEAVATCERLLAGGGEVTFVTGLTSFAPLVEATFEPGPALRRMRPTGRLDVHTRCAVTVIRPGSAVLQHLEGGPEFEVPCERAVLVSRNRSVADLQAPLLEAGIAARTIGDALSQRDLKTAIQDGHDAAMAI
jgi:2,4-dienoyl-CoA reductase-like NADH-dependent reductase (Old Yellow Enzyme family)